MTEVVWKPIKGYEDRYLVSNRGEIASIFPRPVASRLNRQTGYRVVDLFSGKGGRKTRSVHRLVAEAFLANPENLPQVNHKNGVKHDNRLENLEWCDESENQVHRMRTLKKVHNRVRVKCVETGKIYDMAILAAEDVGLANSGDILRCARGVKGYHSAGGYHWELVN